MSTQGRPANIPPRKKHYLDDQKLRLYGEKLPNATGSPTMTITIVGNNPRIIVYTNIPNDKDNGRIQAELDAQTMYQFLELVRRVIAGPNGDRYVIENKNFTFAGGKKSEEPKLQTKLIIGKDQDGKIYLSLLSWDQDRPKAKFVFGKSRFHTLAKGGIALTDAEVSEIVAVSWVNLISELMTNVMVAEYVEPEKRVRAESYGNNKRQEATVTSDFDDDLPM